MSHPLVLEILYRIGYCFWSTLFKIFYDLKIEGAEHIPAKASLLAANHVSFYDPPLIGCALIKPIQYLARKTLFKPPILDWLLPLLGGIPLDQDKPDLNAMRQTFQTLREGKSILLFPEGARSLNGEVQPAESGVGFMIAKARVPVVPMRIIGAFEAWPPGGHIRLFKPIRIIIGLPIEFHHPIAKEDYQKVAQAVMNAISNLGNNASHHSL